MTLGAARLMRAWRKEERRLERKETEQRHLGHGAAPGRWPRTPRRVGDFTYTIDNFLRPKGPQRFS